MGAGKSKEKTLVYSDGAVRKYIRLIDQSAQKKITDAVDISEKVKQYFDEAKKTYDSAVIQSKDIKEELAALKSAKKDAIKIIVRQMLANDINNKEDLDECYKTHMQEHTISYQEGNMQINQNNLPYQLEETAQHKSDIQPKISLLEEEEEVF
jgi:hypothetical protein